MENARIIKLDAPLTVTVSSFGEAFGEYSELRGRGRARRAARKADRQAKRQQKRMTRIQNRAERKRTRQEIRAEQQEARQARKDTRKTRRLARKEMGADEPEAESTENGAPEPVGDEEQGQPTQQEGAGEGEFETTEDSDIEAGQEESGEEEGYEGESEFNGEYYDSFDGTSGSGIEYDNLGENNEIYALQDDDFYSFVDESSSADGFDQKRVRARIGKGTKSVAMKSEWNKEMVSRLQDKVDAIDAELNAGTSPERENMLGIKRAKLIENITLHKDRAVSFDGLMNDYVNAEGDYSGIDGDTSDADGDYENASGKRKGKARMSRGEVAKKKAKIVQGKKKRFAEVSAAKREARKQRVKVRGLATKVGKNLNPKFGKNLIVIPEKEIGQSSAEGTGLIALDDINDFDAPRENEYSLASGTTLKNVNWKGVLIGVAIAGLAIYGAKKAKLF